MKWREFYEKFGALPLITPQMIYPWVKHPASQQVQLSRWVKEGRLIKLTQGKYVFANSFRKGDLSLQYIANQLVYPSYVSLESALSEYGFIPEAVFAVTSITTRRPVIFQTPLGAFIYRHVKKSLLWGYRTLGGAPFDTLMALPEKALLDLFYLWRGEMNQNRLKEMRFQNLERIDRKRLLEFTRKMASRKVERIVKQFFLQLLEEEVS